MSCRYLNLVVLMGALVLVGCQGGPSKSASGPKVKANDLSQPLQGQPGDVVVLVFASPDCPISNALAPEYQRIHAQLEAGTGRMYLVHARPDVTRARATKHAVDYKLEMPVLLDGDHELVKKMKATVTPEAVVLVFEEDGSWKKAYQGKINDLYASLGNRRDHPTQFWLRDAIDASFDGQAVEVTYRKPLGCYIEQQR